MGEVVLLGDLYVVAEDIGTRPATPADLISVLSHLNGEWRGAEWRWVCDYPDFVACDENDVNGAREQYPKDHAMCGMALVWRIPTEGET